MDKNITRNVAGILSFGIYNGANRKKVWIEYCIAVLILCGMIALSVIMMTIEQQKNPENIFVFIISLLSCIIAIFFILFIVSIIVFRNEIIRKRIDRSIQDAIITDAYSKMIDRKTWLGVPLIKLQVDFKINGIKYTRSSEMENKNFFNLGKPNGYLSGLDRYANKKIRILYSPKYDEVMILKDLDCTSMRE